MGSNDPLEMISSVRISCIDEDDDEKSDNIEDGDDDYDDEEEEEENRDPVTLGLLEKPKNQWCLLRQYFPSKAGGFPAWLDPVNLPSGRSGLCDICGEPLQFLLQIYAPIEKENTFHRTLFVFMCPSMNCLLRDQHESWKHHSEKVSRSVKVFRCQLPRINPFYSSEHPEHKETSKPSEKGAALCDWCGTWKGDKLCSSCRYVHYCSEKHQGLHWRSGHNIACQQMRILSQTSNFKPDSGKTTSVAFQKVASNTLWPEFEIITDDECEFSMEVSEGNSYANNSLITRDHMDDAMNSLLENFQGDGDKKTWASFQERIAKVPEQVLRYYRNANATPLWPMSTGRPSKVDIPRCFYCGSPLCCEFQILPQLLYYFGVENNVDSLDWATIVVYTCEASCEGGLAYKEEYAWVQLYSLATSV